jgi:hypothetical protein
MKAIDSRNRKKIKSRVRREVGKYDLCKHGLEPRFYTSQAEIEGDTRAATVCGICKRPKLVAALIIEASR